MRLVRAFVTRVPSDGPVALLGVVNGPPREFYAKGQAHLWRTRVKAAGAHVDPTSAGFDRNMLIVVRSLNPDKKSRWSTSESDTGWGGTPTCGTVRSATGSSQAGLVSKHSVRCKMESNGPAHRHVEGDRTSGMCVRCFSIAVEDIGAYRGAPRGTGSNMVAIIEVVFLIACLLLGVWWVSRTSRFRSREKLRAGSPEHRRSPQHQGGSSEPRLRPGYWRVLVRAGRWHLPTMTLASG